MGFYLTYFLTPVRNTWCWHVWQHMGGKTCFNNHIDFSAPLLPQPSNSNLFFQGPSSLHSPARTKRKIIWSLKSEKAYTPKTKPVRQLSQNLQTLLTDSLHLPWLQSSQCHQPALFLGAFQQFSDRIMWIQINERSNNTLFLFFNQDYFVHTSKTDGKYYFRPAHKKTRGR